MKLTSEKAREMSLKAHKAKRVSLRKTIDKMCKYCIYDTIGGDGTWRQQTEACTDTYCPLYEVRPISDSSGDLDA